MDIIPVVGGEKVMLGAEIVHILIKGEYTIVILNNLTSVCQLDRWTKEILFIGV